MTKYRKLENLEAKTINIKWSQIFINIWRTPSLSELTPMLFNSGLTHLVSEASFCIKNNSVAKCTKIISRKITIIVILNVKYAL